MWLLFALPFLYGLSELTGTVGSTQVGNLSVPVKQMVVLFARFVSCLILSQLWFPAAGLPPAIPPSAYSGSHWSLVVLALKGVWAALGEAVIFHLVQSKMWSVSTVYSFLSLYPMVTCILLHCYEGQWISPREMLGYLLCVAGVVCLQ